MVSKWRVVAVRATGQRLVVDEAMSLDSAKALRERLTRHHSFPAVFMEPDEPVEVHLWDVPSPAPLLRDVRVNPALVDERAD